MPLEPCGNSTYHIAARVTCLVHNSTGNLGDVILATRHLSAKMYSWLHRHGETVRRRMLAIASQSLHEGKVMSIAGDAKAHSPNLSKTKDISTRHDCSIVILDIYNPSNTENGHDEHNWVRGNLKTWQRIGP